MDVKKESPLTLAGDTGNANTRGKGTKRKRIQRFKLVFKWQTHKPERASR